MVLQKVGILIHNRHYAFCFFNIVVFFVKFILDLTFSSLFNQLIGIKALAIAIRTIAIAIAIVAKKAIEYCNMQ